MQKIKAMPEYVGTGSDLESLQLTIFDAEADQVTSNRFLKAFKNIRASAVVALRIQRPHGWQDPGTHCTSGSVEDAVLGMINGKLDWFQGQIAKNDTDLHTVGLHESAVVQVMELDDLPTDSGKPLQ